MYRIFKKAGDSIGVEIKSEIQSEGKIINELSVNDIKESTAVLFAIDGEVEEVEKIERFIDCEYYEVEEQFIKMMQNQYYKRYYLI